MKRRQFIGVTGSTAILSFAGYPVWAQPLNKVDLVDTPAKRLKYTQKLLKQLCTGPRPSGSKAYTEGAQIIRNEMLLSLPKVSYDSYEFNKWELEEETEFIVGRQHIEAISAYGGKGTPPDGLSGVLQKSTTGYSLVDQTTGEPGVIITIAPFAKAITHDESLRRQSGLPSFNVGKQDVPLLDNAVCDKLPARIKASVRFVPDAKGLNIVGQLPGKLKDEILFLAHADTVYNSPGANDNTASVIVMLMLAHAASAGINNHTLTFVATDNEEFGLLGATHYAEGCKALNTLRNIRYVVNFDSLTYGPNLWISSQNEEVKDIIRSIHKDLNIKATPNFDSSDGFVMDSAPFRFSGAKALHANSRGYDEKTLPVYHRPDDRADTVPLDCVEISFLVFNEFIRRIDKS